MRQPKLFFHAMASGSGIGKTQTTINASVDSDQELQELFEIFDRDNDGLVAMCDICRVLQSLGQSVTEEQVREEVKRKNGQVGDQMTFYQFCQVFRPTHRGQSALQQTLLRDAFEMMDTEKKGQISETELRQIMNKLGESISEETARQLLKTVDKQGKGYIDVNEFLQLMSNR